MRWNPYCLHVNCSVGVGDGYIYIPGYIFFMEVLFMLFTLTSVVCCLGASFLYILKNFEELSLVHLFICFTLGRISPTMVCPIQGPYKIPLQ